MFFKTVSYKKTTTKNMPKREKNIVIFLVAFQSEKPLKLYSYKFSMYRYIPCNFFHTQQILQIQHQPSAKLAIRKIIGDSSNPWPQSNINSAIP